MDNSSEFRKQKRLGPAPIASFEKSFEDNTSPQGNNSSTTLTAAAATTTTTTTTTTIITEINVIVHGNNDENKSNMDLGKVQIQETKDTSTADKIQNQQQQQQPSISVSTPSRKLHDIGKKLPPLQVLAGDVGGVEGGGGDGDGGGGGFCVGGVIESNYGNTKIIEGKIKTATKLGIATPSTPRIDISRASSSSHHDSRDSSPENVFEQVGTGTLQETIGLGFREEGALDLRSSTEELYFMDPEQKKEEQEKLQQTRKSPIIFKFDDHQAYLQQHQRKDSASSEVAALLCISGRTSRISSVGSQGSAVSRLSAISGVSRSPSPHRMLLETSFCGPKPLDNTVSSNIIGSVEPPTAEALEQILLSRKHDPTQAVLAEGIHIETSPKKQLTNGETKTTVSMSTLSKTTKMQNVGHKTTSAASKKATTRRDSGKQIIGVTPGGTEYIRIKLKPDHMYEDHGLGPNERVIEVSTISSGAVQKKPVSLSIGRDISGSEQRLTPSSSPKPSRHGIFSRDIGGSRSPSPAMVTVSRKSSFCSLFKTKDSPDSPRDRSRSRSKSRDRLTPQSQSGTPSKQKSVLAIFKPKRSGSKSKCSSPIDQDTVSQFDGISQVEFKFKSDSVSEQPSRPSSRLRYYDTPLDGKSIHIPLHTPPEEKQDRKFIINKEMKESESASFPTEITNVVESPKAPKTEVIEQAPSLPPKSPKPPQLEKIQRIENLDAIHSLPEDVCEKERTWSLEVQRHSSQESQEIIAHENTTALPVRRISKPTLTNVIENPEKENRIPPIVSQVQNIIPSATEVIVQAQQHTAPTSREKRRILFATKLGSGSEEQIFSTQFSLSKTESLSSQLSEQTIPESPAAEGRESLHRTDTVIRRTEDMSSSTGLKKKDQFGENKQEYSFKNNHKSTVVATIEKRESIEESKLTNSKPVSVGDDKKPIVVMMRKKDSLEESKRKSKSTSEEDDNTHRHSRYIENFDVKKKFQENNAKWQLSSKNSSDSSIKERDSCTSGREDQDNNTQIEAPTVTTKSKYFEPSITLPQPSVERQSMVSTDEPAESSESERDSEMDPNRIKRHLPRHIGAIEDHESTGLVSQYSFEDELPYVPTTLPEERAHGVSLIPMKERVNMELKTCPVDRPRSTTPMNPAYLEEYCGIITPDDVERTLIRGEKLRISLPRKDSIKDRAQKTKSPRRVSNSSGKSWFEFAEHGIRGQTSNTAMPVSNQQQIGEERRNSLQDDEPPPPLPPRKPSNSTTGQWVNFENIPEKRKPPKRITALPKDSPQESSKLHSTQPSIHYNYVKPEECQCECHEIERESAAHKSIASVDLLQQGEDMQPLLEPEVQEGIDPSDSSLDYSYGAEGLEDIHEPKTYEKVSTLRQTKSNKLQ